MKKISVIVCLLILFLSISWAANSQTKGNDAPVLKRVMLMKYKPEVKEEAIKEVRDLFCGLPKKVPGMLSAEWGTDSDFSREKVYTYCITLTFESLEARKEYEQHPDHQKLAETGPDMVENFYLIDYWTGEE